MRRLLSLPCWALGSVFSSRTRTCTVVILWDPRGVGRRNYPRGVGWRPLRSMSPDSTEGTHHARLDSSVRVGQRGRLFRAGAATEVGHARQSSNHCQAEKQPCRTADDASDNLCHRVVPYDLSALHPQEGARNSQHERSGRFVQHGLNYLGAHGGSFCRLWTTM